METQQLNLLNTRRFFPLFLTQFLGGINDNLFKSAFLVLITSQLNRGIGSPQFLITLSAALFILPFFLFSPIAGQMTDKFDKARLIKLSKCFEVVLTIIAIPAFLNNHVALLMFVLFSLGIQASFLGTLKFAILPDHLDDKELIAANGLLQASTFLAILLGTILGGSLILLTHGVLAIALIMSTLSLIGLFTSFVIPKTRPLAANIKLSLSFIPDTKALIQYTRQHRDLFLTILAISWFWLLGSTFLAEFPLYAKTALRANQNVIFCFFSLFTVGLIAGTLICNRLLKSNIHATYAPLSALGMTLFAIDLYIAAAHPHFHHSADLLTLGKFLQNFSGIRIALDLFLIALCGGIYTIPLYAILQQRSDPAHRGRVFAVNNIFNALFIVSASLGATIMLRLNFSVTQIFLVLAIGNAFVATQICKLLPDALIRAFFQWLMTTIYRVKVKGMEHYYNAGERVILVANHTSFIDAILLASFLPDKLIFAVNTLTAKQWWIRLFLRLVDAYPIDPTNPMALKAFIEFVQQNKRCVIFPEGRITMTGALMKIYEAPGLVADKSGAKILPIRIQGAQFTSFSCLRGKIRTQWFPKITISIFPPQAIDIAPNVKGRRRRQQLSYKLYDLMTEMMFESSNYQQTLFTSLLDARRIHGAKHEIVEDIQREPLNYQKFITRCFILGGVIAKVTKPGDYIGILLPNMTSSVITFFATHAFCRVPAMLNYSTGTHNVVLACQTAQIKKVYTSKRFITVAKLEEMVAELTKLGIDIVYLEDLRSTVTLLDKLKGMVLGLMPRLSYHLINSKEDSRALMSADSAAVVLFTSGSEGTPKGVVLSHTNIQANRCQLSACIDVTASDKVFNVLPIFHSFGLTGGTLLPMLSGVKVFFYPSPLHYRIIPELSYDTNATILFGTDTFLSGYAKYAHPYDFYSMRYVFAGAEKLREETRQLWSQKFGVRIFEGYGTTEASPILATNTPMQHKIGTVGRLLPGLQYKLKPVPGIADGGVLSVYGPNIMKGYLLANQPGVILPPTEGWYETGDVVSVDDVGFLTIKGRVKRFAKIAGEMVSLVMVEQFISKLWPDFQHAVVNIPDAKRGEQLVLVTTNLKATREAVVNFAKENRLGEILIPKKILHLTEMPLLGSGKVDLVTVKNIVSEQIQPDLETDTEEELETDFA